jgi:proline racemase
MAVGQPREIQGVSGGGFVGRLASSVHGSRGRVSRVRVSGHTFYTARSTFLVEDGDPFVSGFELPKSSEGLLAKR